MTILVHIKTLVPDLPEDVYHVSTDWEVSTDKDFNTIVHSSYNNDKNKLEYYTLINLNNVTLYGRSRLNLNIGSMDWSDSSICSSVIKTPTITIQGEPNSIPLAPKIETTPFESSSSTENHISTDWIIYRESDNEIIFSSLKDNNNLTSIQIPINTLQPNVNYYVSVRYYGTNGFSSNAVSNFRVSDVIISEPVLTIEGEPLNVSTGPKILSSPFNVEKGIDEHKYTNWVIEDTNGNNVYNNIKDSVNLTSLDIPIGTLEPNKQYILKVNYIGQSAVSSTAIKTFTTSNVIIALPYLTIEGEPDNVSESPTITTSSFTTISGSDKHYSTDWIITNNIGLEVWSSLNDTNNLNNIKIPYNILENDTEYILKVRHRGINNNSIYTSERFKTNFTKIDKPILTVQDINGNIPLSPTITGTNFTLLAGNDTHVSSDWTVIKISDNTIVYSSLEDTNNLTSIKIPENILLPNTNYKVICKYNGNNASSEEASITFTTSNVIIITPTITITGGPDNVPLSNATIQTSGFTTLIGGDIHISTDWIIHDLNGNVLLSSLNDSSDLIAKIIPNSTLNSNTEYILKIRHRGNLATSDYAYKRFKTQ